MTKENLDQFKSAYDSSAQYHWDDTVLLSAYARKLISAASARPQARALSLGIGRQIVSRSLFETADLSEYHIVEGSPAIIDSYRREASPPDFVHIHHAYFEDIDFDTSFDLIEMGFVLEHVDDPALILKRFRKFLAQDGLLFASVPNARSLHRLLGHAAGLMPDVYALSQADVELGHKRYFDSNSFADLVEECGYEITARHGLMLKPLTTGQIKSLGLDGRFDEALIEVGYGLPDIANCILLEARPA